MASRSSPWLALGALFRFTAIGLRMRAVVESPRMTELNGIAADRVSAFAWALSSLFAGLAGVLIAPRFNTLAAGDFFNLVVVAVAAAAVGRLVSLPRALARRPRARRADRRCSTRSCPAGATTATWLQPLQDNLTPAIPFVVLFGVLVFVPSIRRAREAGDPAGRRRPAAAARVARSTARPPAAWSPRSLGTAAARRRRRRRVHPGRRVVAVPRHPGGRAVDHLPVDHGDHRLRRPDLAVPGRRSRPSARSRCSSSSTATTCPSSSPPLVGAGIAAAVGAAPVAARSGG